MRTVFIQQYLGLGDIIWGQSIAHHFMAKGYRVIWPVSLDLVEGLDRAYPHPHLIFLPSTWFEQALFQNKDYGETDGVLRLPMRYSESLMGKPYRCHMEAKYSFLGLRWQIWKEHAYPNRDEKRENELREALGIAENEAYNLLQLKFGQKGKFNLSPISFASNLRTVYLDFVPGFSLFDWCGIIENASTIHAVSSSSLYLFEVLQLRAKEVHLYARKPSEEDLDYTKFLYSKPYILHE